VSASYLDHLLQYRRVLRQRNRLLAELRGRLTEGCWTRGMRAGAPRGVVMAKRQRFLLDFQPFVEQAYRLIVDALEEPSLSYAPSCRLPDTGDAEGCCHALGEEMKRRGAEERRRGVSLIGPHRDELRLSVNGFDAQGFASQGQHKSLLVALKMAEFRFLQETRGERPILLLDDLFGELDGRRATRILELVMGLARRSSPPRMNASSTGLFAGMTCTGVLRLPGIMSP